ncbi:hypothetical protein LPAF129_19720 [Ligilactobacillus pabuli]|uniref:BREX system P-loop protein BrxC n=1 Tax=Ligilactobacillus pabuli TaxID=2886039 RepID=A0ABQ5JPL2_9LACO|nr:BREX system P-loop protein BrxC [Ligilactobacillus pabuli]GKS82286.1 hypothetical protein LPAF129_19720 [Ligilactobacillus pabuli]
MKINEIFAKSINREIKGVVKVGQIEDAVRKQELEEYVVTKELQKHFASLFEAYQKGINGYTDNMGVWIDGFFGSGKSHFLKILSYLLKNEDVAGKPAIEYFKDDQKIDDPFVMNQIEIAAQVPTDVILFNIDSKAGSNSGHDQNAILHVFLNVFNEMQGYSTVSPYIADLEKELDEAGQFEAFKEKFYELTNARGKGMTWAEGVNHYKLQKGTIKKALVEIGYMSEENAQGYMDELKNPYQITIEEFAKRVSDYVAKKGDNRHVVFLVDEVGQFIGSDVNRMLNLQTIVEELGAQVQGKAWVIVTSQQAIDEVVDGSINGQDFSKIQGRFKTRISMSSANVDEVIKKRILAKNDSAQQRLEQIYQEQQHNINNKIDFQEGIQRQKYDSEQSFAENYPFVPYQFHLLQDSLNAIRLHGSDGKHLSEGERSMLATFQEAAESYQDKEVGALIPFSQFFEGLAQFLDHNHKLVIERAEDDNVVNPKQVKNPFAVQVLKTLFMVKYVDNFKSNLNNLTTLLLTSIDEDRQELENQIQDALKLLEKQDYVLKNLDTYEFLTDAEQDINKEIKNEEVTDSELSKTLGSEFIFLDKVISSTYTYPRLKGRYVFKFNRYIDDVPVGATQDELSLCVYSANDITYHRQEAELKRISINPDSPRVVIDMPVDNDYLNYLKRATQIRKFLQRTHNEADQRQQQIIASKSEERQQLIDSARNFIQTALENSDIYVNGVKLDKQKDFSNTLAEAQQLLIDDIYRSLPNIDAAKGEKDISDLFKEETELVDEQENKKAVGEVADKIATSVGSTGKITLRTLIDTFGRLPYHFTAEDVEWIVAKLFVDGELRAEVNGEKYSAPEARKNPRVAVGYFTKKTYLDKLSFQSKKKINPKQIKEAKEFAKDILKREAAIKNETSDEKILSILNDEITQKIAQLENFAKNPKLPGNRYLEQGINLYEGLQVAIKHETFFDVIGRKMDDFDDWLSEIEDRGIDEFYRDASRREIWNWSLGDLKNFEQVSSLLTEDDEIRQIIEEEKSLMRQDNPKDSLPKLKELHSEFAKQFSDYIDQQWAKYQENSAQKKTLILSHLEMANFESTINQQFLEKIESKFKQKDDDVRDDSNNGKLSNVLLGVNAINAIYDGFVKEIDRKTREVVVTPPEVVEGDDPTKVTPKRIVAPAKPTPKQNRLKSVSWNEINHEMISFKSEEEIDDFLEKIGRQLKDDLKDVDTLNIL